MVQTQRDSVSWLVVISLVMISGCGAEGGRLDAAPPIDSDMPDSGMQDAMLMDTGMPDSGMTDAMVAGPCDADHRVMMGACVPCAAGTSNMAGDDPSGADTECDPVMCPEGTTGMDIVSGCTCPAGTMGMITPATGAPYYEGGCAAILCMENQFVMGNACVDCLPGTTNTAGDDASMGDTMCDAVICMENQFVMSNACVDCPAGTTNAAGDDASMGDTMCEAVICMENQFVMGNACVDCPAGTTNPAGDDASMGDTMCMTVVCLENEFVMSNACVACPAGTSNAAGDDASMADTSCDPTSCPANSSGVDVASGCTCNDGFIGTITPTTTAPYYSGACSTATTDYSYTGRTETFTVPAGVSAIRVTVNGSAGGTGTSGGGRGAGARMIGTVAVTAGEVLTVYAGGNTGRLQRGGDCSYVARGDTPLVVAGGGGSGGWDRTGIAAVTTESGVTADSGTTSSGTNGTPGSAGSGGGAGDGSWGVGGGGGWNSPGRSGSGSTGGAARCMGTDGTTYAGGSGGGYSGGGGAAMASGWGTRGGGAGGSFNSGTDQENTAGAHTATGTVSITLVANCPPPTDIVISEIDYDQPGADSAEFLEIHNPTTTAIDLSNYRVVVNNGSSTAGGASYGSLRLTGMLAAGAYAVVTTSGSGSLIIPAGTMTFAGRFSLQNGAPDAVMLIETSAAAPRLVDAIVYEGMMSTLLTSTGASVSLGTQGESAGRDSGSESLARISIGNICDRDTPGDDWAPASTPTPGAENRF